MSEPTAAAAPETSAPPKSRSGPLWIILAAILILCLVTCVFSVRTSQMAKQALEAAGVSPTGQTREDDVAIMEDYWIRSTLPVSDAYKSGDDSRLDSRQKETLDLAVKTLEEIFPDGMEGLSDYEKELAVYEWMTRELQYDTGVLQVIPTTEADADNPYGTLKYHNAVCVGYATTFRLFMQMMDIPCMVVHNTDLYHSWDLVQLDDEWYHVDIYSDQNGGNYANFNMNDEMCAQGHDWDQDFFPAAEGTRYNYAIQNARDVEDIYAVPGLVKAALDEETGSLFLSFDPIDEAHAQIVETMMDGVKNCMMEDDAFMDLWMEWRWIHDAGNRYVLAVYIEGFDQDENGFEIDEADQEKIDAAIADAFGVSPDWEEVDYDGGGMAEEVCEGGPVG